jgi:hypothetical protein
MPAPFVSGAEVVLIVQSKEPLEPESRAASIVEDRLRERSSVEVSVASEGEGLDDRIGEADITFVIGIPGRHGVLDSLMRELTIDLPRLPGSGEIHPEGFSVKTGTTVHGPVAAVAGADERGVLYGAGALLRSLIYLPGSIDIPRIDICERPSFMIRGTEASASGPREGARERGSMREQTEAERHRGIEDLILLGAKILQGEEDLVRGHGCMTYSGRAINALHTDFPQSWAALPSNSLHIKVSRYFRRSYICPSVPEAREALISSYEKEFREMSPVEFYCFHSGDVGGCTCGRCAPWGATFVELAHRLSDLLHRHHPDAKVLLTMQNLTDEGDRAVLEYVKEAGSDWFHGIRYAPGGNEMTSYNRGDVNPRWFRYPGMGKNSNYLRHMYHELPGDKSVILFSDITHWIRSQYGVERPDVSLAVVYNRRAWNSRPRHFYRVARDVLHYADGDMFYSEGMHDDFNKWLWFRMLWDPNLALDDIVREYCRYWFGPDAEGSMAEAIYLMERTLERPVIGNGDISRAMDLVLEAKGSIPSNLLDRDYRWRIMAQKALLDRYIQLKLERGEELKREASILLDEARVNDEPSARIAAALSVLGREIRTPDMESIMNRIRDLGRESNSMIGYREPAYFDVDEFDITEIGWWRASLRGAIETGDADRMRNAAAMLLAYDDPGEGGYYEGIGWLDEPVHLVLEETILGYFPVKGPALHSHHSMGYSWRKPGAHITFHFDGLDPDAHYMVRISSGFHCEEMRGTMPGEVPQQLEANGEIVGESFPLTLGEVRLFEFEIPRRLTAEGGLELVIRSKCESFPLAVASEIWLMDRARMPWTVGQGGEGVTPG